MYRSIASTIGSVNVMVSGRRRVIWTISFEDMWEDSISPWDLILSFPVNFLSRTARL
jgi:hypothetical protein